MHIFLNWMLKSPLLLEIIEGLRTKKKKSKFWRTLEWAETMQQNNVGTKLIG